MDHAQAPVDDLMDAVDGRDRRIACRRAFASSAKTFVLVLSWASLISGIETCPRQAGDWQSITSRE